MCVIYCSNIDDVFEALKSEHHSNEWRIFIDSSKAILKVALSNVNIVKQIKASLKAVHASALKETHESKELILRLINYSAYNWNICGDFKVIDLFLGMQIGYIKHQCFLCLWDSRDDEQHYIKKDWPLRETFVPGRFNIHHVLLVDLKEMYLPLMHIKLGLSKNFFKTMDQDGRGFRYLQAKFLAKFETRLNAGIFIGPEIRKLMINSLKKILIH